MGTRGETNGAYLVSTSNTQLLADLGRVLCKQFQPREHIRVHCHGGQDIYLPAEDDEAIFLSEELRTDIETQVSSFFADGSRYAALGLRHRRGFLFVGPSGTGKTMMVRHLIRRCHAEHQVQVLALAITRHTEDLDVMMLFKDAVLSAPSLVILEDLDSLMTTSRVSRANLLAQLDGLDAQAGPLVIATTNHPEQIDPALVHRPSRFDRVWHFILPDEKIRSGYLQHAFPQQTPEAIRLLARQTHGWSFAFLNELRTTASILALDRGRNSTAATEITEAFALLAPQFEAGKKNHVASEVQQLGFTGEP
jgi:ATP-dependent 26S proteasome regulatory subunit